MFSLSCDTLYNNELHNLIMLSFLAATQRLSNLVRFNFTLGKWHYCHHSFFSIDLHVYFVYQCSNLTCGSFIEEKMNLYYLVSYFYLSWQHELNCNHFGRDKRDVHSSTSFNILYLLGIFFRPLGISYIMC